MYSESGGNAKLQTFAGDIMVKETMTEKLQRERKGLQSRLDELDHALKMLEENPTVQKVIDTLSRITHF